MNRYGARALEHWKRWLPTKYSQLDDPETFFTELGEEVAGRIDELSDALAGSDPPGEGFLEKWGRLNMSRFNAESDLMREMVLIEPEPGVE